MLRIDVMFYEGGEWQAFESAWPDMERAKRELAALRPRQFARVMISEVERRYTHISYREAYAHAIRFPDGSEWDAITGWRTHGSQL